MPGPHTLPMHKAELRQQIRNVKRQFSPQQLEELSLPIVQRLRKRLADATLVFAYYSLPDEVNTHAMVDELLAEGKTVLLPKVIDDETMAWFPYTGARYLTEGALHILEPEENHGDRLFDINSLLNQNTTVPVILVPGLAFDSKGHRLGRGRGYYDRFLSTLSSFHTIGVCFDFQKVPEVPVDEYDIPVDEVV